MLGAIRAQQSGNQNENFRHRILTNTLSHLQCLSNDSHAICDDARQFAPLSMDWHSEGNLLLASDEGGFIRVYELTRQSTLPLDHWMLVDNAVFDVKWRPCHSSQAVASSGSWSVQLIDVPTRAIVTELTGHTASVRTCVFAPQSDGNLLASGSRDGTIRVWDLRQNNNSKAMHVIQIDQAKGSAPETFGASPRTRTGLIGSPARVMLASSRRNTGSVVGLGFLDPFSLVSCSDKQGLAFWDLRYAHGGRRIKLEESDPTRGLVHIATDPVSRRISVMSCNNVVYIIDVDLQRIDAVLSGTTVSSFYIQSAFSPDGQFVVAGSTGRVAPIWSLRESKSYASHSPLGTRPVTVLDADDAGEVSVVAWNPVYPGVIATGSDSFCIRIWRPRLDERPASDNDLSVLGRARSPPKVTADEFGRVASPLPWHRVVRRDPSLVPVPATPPATPQSVNGDENSKPSSAFRNPPATMPSRMVHRTLGTAVGSASKPMSPAGATSAVTNATTPRPNRRRPLSALGSSNPSPIADLRKWFQPQPNDK